MPKFFLRRSAELLNRILSVADRTCEVLIVGLFAGIVVVGGLQVFCRYVLRSSLGWSEEFQRYGLIWMVFLALVVGYRRGAHIGMEFFLEKMPHSVRAALAWLTDLLWLTLGLAMVIFTAFYQSAAGMTFLVSVGRQRSAGMGLRMDIIYACIVAGGAYLVIAALCNLTKRASGQRDTERAEEKPC